MALHIDFETRSTFDLTKGGVHNYAAHATTDILCLAYRINDDPVQLWASKSGEPLPDDLLNFIRLGGKVYAHNAQFEYHMWNTTGVNKYGFPRLPLKNLYCTAAIAYYMSLPGSLAGASTALRMKIEKDDAGRRLMLQMCKPRRIDPDGTIVWWEDEDRLNRLYEYCKQDVIVESEMHKLMFDLSDHERAIWLMDQEINNRGFRIDVESVQSAIEFSQKEKERADILMEKITNGVATSVTDVRGLTKFANSFGPMPSVAKGEIQKVLQGELHPDLRKALSLRLSAGKSSVAKLDKMLILSSHDGICRGAFQYHAAHTGRWGGRGIQPQNMPRPTISQADIDSILEHKFDVDFMETLYDEPLQRVSDCLRGFICARDGHVFVAADYSAIEARFTAWEANDQGDLEVFRGDGKIYESTAAGIFGVPKESIGKGSDERQVGKTAALALGYGGGIGAFANMALAFGVDMEPLFESLWNASTAEEISKAETLYKRYAGLVADPVSYHFGVASDLVKQKWRATHPNIVSLWRGLEDSAISAIEHPGDSFSYRNNTFFMRGNFLVCQIASGRQLFYPYPLVTTEMTDFGEKKALSYKTLNINGQFVRKFTYGGSLTENIVQAGCRDLLSDAMLRLHTMGSSIVIHVHDEIVTEVKQGEEDVEFLEKQMCILPSWAAGLPIAAEGWVGKRFRK